MQTITIDRIDEALAALRDEHAALGEAAAAQAQMLRKLEEEAEDAHERADAVEEEVRMQGRGRGTARTLSLSRAHAGCTPPL